MGTLPTPKNLEPKPKPYTPPPPARVPCEPAHPTLASAKSSFLLPSTCVISCSFWFLAWKLLCWNVDLPRVLPLWAGLLTTSWRGLLVLFWLEFLKNYKFAFPKQAVIKIPWASQLASWSPHWSGLRPPSLHHLPEVDLGRVPLPLYLDSLLSMLEGC